LQLLHDCDVTYREPGAAAARTLQIRGGWITGGTGPGDETDPPGGLARAPEGGGPFDTGGAAGAFDRARYDRLRILTTELKRVLRDGGDACVATPSGRRIEAPRLRAIAAVV